MTTIVGLIMVTLSVLGGYTLHGGHLGLLFQPTEFMIIGGAAFSSVIMASSSATIKDMVRMLGGTVKGKNISKEQYMDVLMLLFELVKTAKANPLSIEAHVENPDSSDIFNRYPSVLNNHHVIEFLCDTLKVQISSPMTPYDLEELMDKDIETVHKSENTAIATVQRMGDALPGLGIVAAVLGIVITMGKLSQGKEVIGHSVAAALVGTFLGVLLAYGFVQPIAAKMENNMEDEANIFQVVKNGLIAYAKDTSPKVCVEFARRTIPPHARPSFDEVDEATSNLKK